MKLFLLFGCFFKISISVILLIFTKEKQESVQSLLPLIKSFFDRPTCSNIFSVYVTTRLCWWSVSVSGGGGSPVFPDAAALSSSSEGCVNTEVNGSRPLCSTFKKPTDPRAADTLSSVWAECAVNQPNKISVSMTFTLEDPAPQRINTLNFKSRAE